MSVLFEDLTVCSECKGEGNLIIHNAYDPIFSETIPCDYCDGEGSVDVEAAGNPSERN